MRFIFYLLILGVVPLLNGCEDKSKNKITKNVRKWQNKEVVFPSNLVFTKHGRDTVEYELPRSSHKILVYVDSIGCTSCKLQLHKWKEFIEEVDFLTFGTVAVLFFFHPKDLREISYLLKRDGVDIPVCIDVDDKLNTMNRFPVHQEFQTFLLDDENKVVFIGNLVRNLRIRGIYLTEVSQPTHNTQVETDNTEFDLETIPKGDAKTIGVSIKSVGGSPFMIFDTRASCGCTHIEYEKPVHPDSTTIVSITYNADDRGDFNRFGVRQYGQLAVDYTAKREYRIKTIKFLKG